MMGKLPSGQDHLFYAFNLESVVPQKHLLRSIARSSSQNLGLAEWPVWRNATVRRGSPGEIKLGSSRNPDGTGL